MASSMAAALLAAAEKLTVDGRETFTVADLTVAAWRADPRRFGLAGYPEYPDASKVAGLLMGRRGLARPGGELVRDRPGAYRLRGSPRRFRPARPARTGQPEPAAPAQLPAGAAAVLAAVLGPGAEEVAEAQGPACRAARLAWCQRAGGPEVVRAAVAEAAEFMGHAVLPGGRHVSARDIATAALLAAS